MWRYSLLSTYIIIHCNAGISEAITSYTYNNNNNTHIAAIAPLPLTTHPRWWAELLTFGPKCTLPF